MANITITGLVAATTIAPTTDQIPIVAASITKKVTPSLLVNSVLNAATVVGIGTNSPEVKVEVYGAGSISTSWTNGDAGGAALYLRDSGGAGGNGGQILFGANQGSFAGIKGLLINGTGPAGHLLFQTRETSGDILERMRITSAGILQVNSDALINGVTVGRGSGSMNTNTAVGLNALNSNTTGGANTSVGQSSLYTNSTGNYNTALGWYALNLSIGSGNTAVGQASLYTNSTGNGNTAVGQASLNLSTGTANTAVGSSSGNAITSGNNNVVIGSYTGAAAPISATGSNFIVLSDGAGNVRQTIDASGHAIFAATVRTSGYTIATLPAGVVGMRAYVTNGQASPTYLLAVTATGTVTAPVFYNGTAWVYG